MLILPKELLTFKKVGRRVSLNFATEDDVNEILQLWHESKGLTLREMRKKFSELEDFANYKFVRGLLYILSKISDFESSEENAYKIREFLFSFGPVLEEDRRNKILLEAERVFGFRISDDKMWGDLDSFKVFRSLKMDFTPLKIAGLYNLALILGTSSVSNKIRIKTSKNIRNILYYTRKLGLMYEVDRGEIIVFGPESIIRNSQRYGLAFARLISKILKQGDFEISIELPQGILNLSDSDIHNFIFLEDEEEKFDSSYEESFFRLVREVFPSVKILREPEVDISDAGIFIPDFKLISGQNHIFVEVIGFWTPEYLLRKAEKLKRFKKKILLIASEEFALSQLNPKEQNSGISNNPDIRIITFKRELPYLEIIKFLKSNLAVEVGRAQKKALIPEYILESLSAKLHDGMDIRSAKDIIASEIDIDFKEVLKHLNYSIEWTSLVPPVGRIRKKQDKF